jgi:cell division protein FtsW (lipid II flippase)
MRAAAVGSAVLMLAFAAVVAARAGLALPRWRQASRRLIWVVVAYALVGVVLHVVTPSARERMLWLPVVLMLAGCALVVARSPARAE